MWRDLANDQTLAIICLRYRIKISSIFCSINGRFILEVKKCHTLIKQTLILYHFQTWEWDWWNTGTQVPCKAPVMFSLWILHRAQFLCFDLRHILNFLHQVWSTPLINSTLWTWTLPTTTTLWCSTTGLDFHFHLHLLSRLNTFEPLSVDIWNIFLLFYLQRVILIVSFFSNNLTNLLGSRYAFSANNRPTMEPYPDPNVPFGTATQMSNNDITRLNRLYKCWTVSTSLY